MITAFSIIAGITLIVALGYLWHCVVHSPDGHEDASGFHLDVNQLATAPKSQDRNAEAICHTMAVSRTEHPFA